MRITNATNQSYFRRRRKNALSPEIDMITLTAPPLTGLLDRLFAQADRDFSSTPPLFAALSQEDRIGLMTSATEYHSLYSALKDEALAVSRETGTLLYMLARATRARTIVEFGTSFGLSTLHLAAALRDNGGGQLITSEFEPSKAARARATFAEAGFDDLIELREGDALETLSRDLPRSIDMVLLDGAKGLYPAILDRLEPCLRPGALILADNANWSAEYLARVRDPETGYLSVPFAGEVELSMRLPA
jgi:predicted O-methyltransferase YrrM